jgi:thioredoxin 1
MQVKKVDDLDSYRSEVVDNADKNILIKFEADWCNPCKAMASVVEEVAKQFPDIKVLSVDVEGDGIEEILREFDVRSVPTFVKIRGDNGPKKICGTVSKSELSIFLREEQVCG